MKLTDEERALRTKWGYVSNWGKDKGKILCWETCGHGWDDHLACPQCGRCRRSHVIGDAIEQVLLWAGPLGLTELVPHVQRLMPDDRVHEGDVRTAVMAGADPEEGIDRFRFTDDWEVDLGDPSVRQTTAPAPTSFEGRFWDYGSYDGGWSVRDNEDPLWRNLLNGPADAFNGYKVRVTIEAIGPKEDL